MNEPRKIITQADPQEWHAVTVARRCKCSHDHYGRIPTAVGARVPPAGLAGLAPQWTYCEDSTCSCSCLCPATEGDTP